MSGPKDDLKHHSRERRVIERLEEKSPGQMSHSGSQTKLLAMRELKPQSSTAQNDPPPLAAKDAINLLSSASGFNVKNGTERGANLVKAALHDVLSEGASEKSLQRLLLAYKNAVMTQGGSISLRDVIETLDNKVSSAQCSEGAYQKVLTSIKALKGDENLIKAIEKINDTKNFQDVNEVTTLIDNAVAPIAKSPQKATPLTSNEEGTIARNAKRAEILSSLVDRATDLSDKDNYSQETKIRVLMKEMRELYEINPNKRSIENLDVNSQTKELLLQAFERVQAENK